MKLTALSRMTVAALAIVALASCDGKDPTTIDASILRGLSESTSNDSAYTQPPPQTPPTPGSFHGFVLGPGTGPDTMATAPRLAGVAVTAYTHLGWNGDTPVVGPVAASLTTDANGAFQSGELPGGNYLVTFVPPADGIYRGVYVTTTIYGGSNSGNWWVVLPRK